MLLKRPQEKLTGFMVIINTCPSHPGKNLFKKAHVKTAVGRSVWALETTRSIVSREVMGIRESYGNEAWSADLDASDGWRHMVKPLRGPKENGENLTFRPCDQ